MRKHANDNERFALVPRRGMMKDEAAEYCGCTTTGAFDEWIRKGIVPAAIPGTNRWDRKAIDLALDRASNIETPVASGGLLEAWKVRRAACR